MFQKDDTVRILASSSARFAGRYKVVKVNPTKYKLQPLDTTLGGSGLLNAPHNMVVAEDAAEADKPAANPYNFVPGTLVTVEGDRRIDPKKLFVVTKYDIAKANIVQVGGDTSGRYWRFPFSFLRVVDPASAITPSSEWKHNA